MRPLSAQQLLDVWEQGLPRDGPRRALSLLAASGEGPSDVLARLPVGCRDVLLMQLRELTFGPDLECTAECPACAARLELAFRVEDLRQPGAAAAPATGRVEAGGRTIEFRLPDSADLLAIAGVGGVAEGRRHLLERCLLGGVPDDLPEETVAAVAEEMARLDPQADVEIALVCPGCGHRWNAAFDIAAQLWSEVDSWAQRLLRDVHTLASAYGWSEADILALSAWRRQAYVAMAVP